MKKPLAEFLLKVWKALRPNFLRLLSSSIFSLGKLQSFSGHRPDEFQFCLLWVQRLLLLDANFCHDKEKHPILMLELCQYGILMVKSCLISSLITHPQLTLSTTVLGVYWFLIALCMCLWLNFPSHCFHLMFIFRLCWKAVLPGSLTMSPPPLCPPPPNPFLQITVSLAQGYERTPSSPKQRFKSYAYAQAAYVTTSDPTRSPFPSQVCQHLLSVLQSKECLHP